MAKCNQLTLLPFKRLTVLIILIFPLIFHCSDVIYWQGVDLTASTNVKKFTNLIVLERNYNAHKSLSCNL